MSDFLSFTFQLKRQGGLRQLHLKSAHSAVSPHLQSTHHSYCLLIYVLKVFLLGEESKEQVCLDLCGSPGGPSHYPQHIVGARYPGSAEYVLVPSL